MVKFSVQGGDLFEAKASAIVISIGKKLELGGFVCRKFIPIYNGKENNSSEKNILIELKKSAIDQNLLKDEDKFDEDPHSQSFKAGIVLDTEGGKSKYDRVFCKFLSIFI